MDFKNIHEDGFYDNHYWNGFYDNFRDSEALLNAVNQHFLATVKKGVDLVVIMFPRRDEKYSYFKKAGETKLGIMTQCVLSRQVVGKFQKGPDDQTLGNLLQKINTKTGGTNHGIRPQDKPNVGDVPLFNKPIIIFGADVTHTTGDLTQPSVAAVVASQDSKPFRYGVEIRVQPSRQEIIGDLAQMVKNLLIRFYQKNRQAKPQRILFYRDGVSEGQFAQVLSHELRAIRQACSSLDADYQPPITFVIVQKRH